MFDFGFTELMLIALVALIVVGPERLPKVARTAGHLLGRMQRYVSDVKSDISREMQLEDLKKLQKQVEQQAKDLESSVRSEMNKVDGDLRKTAAEIERDLTPAATESSIAQSADQAPAPVTEAIPAPPMPDSSAEAARTKAESRDQLELGLSSTDPDRKTTDKS